MENIKISSWQYISLLALNILSTAILFPVAFIAQQTGRDAWAAILLSTAAGVLLAFFIIQLVSRYPGLNILQISEKVFGFIFGKAVGLSYAVIFMLFAGIILREFASFMAAAFMPETPIELFSIILVLVCIYPAYQGLEVIARLSEVILPVIAVFLSLFMVLMANEFDLSSLLPLLEAEPVSILRGALIFFVWSGQIFFVSMLYPYHEKQENAFSGALFSLLIVCFFLVSGALSVEFIFGFPFTERFVFALLAFVRMVSIAGFVLERVDAVVIVIWVSGVFVKISFLLYLSTQSLKNVFGLREYRPLLLPAAVLSSSLSVALFENTMELKHFLNYIMPLFLLPFVAGIPMILLVFSLIKGQKLN